MKSYFLWLLFVWFNFVYYCSERKCCCKCCACCCCHSGAHGSRNSLVIPGIKADFISFDEFSGYFSGAKINKGVINNKIDELNNELYSVKSLIGGRLNTKNFLGRSYSFPHIHWNGSIPGKYRHLCYVLAPLNIILHLYCIREFFKSENVPSYEVSDSSDCYRFFEDIAFIRTFRIYVNALEMGESFTLDIGENGDYYFTLGLDGKVDVVDDNAMYVIKKTFGSIKKFRDCPLIYEFDLCDEYMSHFCKGVDWDGEVPYDFVRMFDCKDFCDRFCQKMSNNHDLCNYDILFFSLQELCRVKDKVITIKVGKEEKLVDNYFEPKPIKNLTESFECEGKKYFLKGLLFWAAGDRRLSYDQANDYFSIVYDKNAPDKSKPYVYCQLDLPLKYYSLRDIEDGINKMDGTEFPYKYNYLAGLFYEKVTV